MKLSFALLALLGTAIADPWANPIPKPVSMDWIDETVRKVDSGLSLKGKHAHKALIKNAFKRMVDTLKDTKYFPAIREEEPQTYEAFPTGNPYITKREHKDKADKIKNVKVTIADEGADLQMYVDEAYNMTVSGDEIDISAGTTWGALNAFSTLQQLILYNETTHDFFIEGSFDIVDAPIYPHRGILIDTARNFVSVKKIKENIDLMALSKLNVLHWHLSDTQSWPVEMKSYPEMTQDAYSKRETYSQKDVKDIVAYAKARGVRVIGEIDMPGHSRAGWRKVDPEMVVGGDSWWSNDVWADHTAVEPPPGQLDIIYNGTYDVVSKVYNELTGLFDDEVFSVGLDELQSNDYNFSSNIQKWFAEDQSRTYNDLVQYWVDKAFPIFLDETTQPNRTLLTWEDFIINSPHANNISEEIKDRMIVQSWNAATNLKNLTAAGYKVIASNSDWLYLDQGTGGGWISNDPRYVDVKANWQFNYGYGGSWAGPYKNWQRMYDFEPTLNLTDSEAKNLIGLEACLWGEQTDTEVFIQYIWPRSAALGEMAWSGNKDSTGMLRTSDLTARILNFREYLVAMGYSATPLQPKYCLKHAHICDFYYNQTILAEYS